MPAAASPSYPVRTKASYRHLSPAQVVFLAIVSSEELWWQRQALLARSSLAAYSTHGALARAAVEGEI